ncbi:MAG: ABC transporter permease [Elusimicrobia bacterium]|nr:ABC transporter permease [Elusimicrobiota bacterium]
MRKYIIGRLVQAIPLLLGVIVINFMLLHLAPGDPVSFLVGDFPAPEEYVRELRVKFGLDKPLLVQLGLYLRHVLQGDLGFSFAQDRAVLTVVFERAGATAVLSLTALSFGTLIGVSVGILAAIRHRSVFDGFATGLSVAGFSLPVFWLGQVALIMFSLKLGLFPIQGMLSIRESYTGLAYYVDIAIHLILPALVLSLQLLAITARVTRTSMLDILTQEYMVTARAKGLLATTVILKHALRNALIPVVTIVGHNLGYVLAGSALVETVFGWPGIGRLLFDSLRMRDYPVLLGIFLVVSLSVIVANLVTDLLYGALDPRIRY